MDKYIQTLQFKRTILSLFIAAALTACGGSGSSNSNDPQPEPTPTPTPDPTPTPTPTPEPTDPCEVERCEAINVQVIDGYLNNATVFLDLNRNFIQDEDEPVGKTNENGVVSLKVPASKLSSKESIKVISISKKGDTNTVFGKPSVLNQDIVMSSNIYLDGGIPKDENFVNPFTTLTDLSLSKDESEKLSDIEYLNKVKDVAASVGVDASAVNTDYNNVEQVTKDNATALTAGEIIVRSNLLPQNLESTKDVSELETYTLDTVKDSLAQYKETVSTVVDNTDLSDAGNIGNNISDSIDNVEAKLGSSFRVLASGPADEWRCGVTKNNNVYCWGVNAWGNLGDPDIYPKDEEGNPVEDGESVKGNFSAKPVAVKIKQGDKYVPLSGVKTVALGNVHACAVTYVGEVYCWGGNYHGQLGNVPNDQEMTEDKIKSYHAVKVLKGQQEGTSEYLSNIDYLQLGQNHSCALSNDGEVFCWGDNSSYELGGRYEGYEHQTYNKDITNYSGQISLVDWIKNVHVPVKLKFPESVAKVKFLSYGYWAHCALVENVDVNDKHNMYCWGNDRAGSITHNYKQYKDDFKKNYEGKFVKGAGNDVYNLDEYWNWYMYEPSGDWYPLYGAPITLIDSYYREIGHTESFNSSIAYNSFKEQCFEKIDCRIDGTTKSGGYVEYKINGGDPQNKFFEDLALYEEFVEKLKTNPNVEIVYAYAPKVTLTVLEKDESRVLDLVNVRYVALSTFDGLVNFVTEDEPEILRQTWYGSYWEYDFSDQFGFETSKIYTNPEEKPTCILTTDEKVYCLGQNMYGMLGQGSDYSGWGSGYVKDPEGLFTLENVKELSMVKRSICASVADKKLEDGSIDNDQLSLYCWGSSAYGQQGFDNGLDDDWSVVMSSSYWRGNSAENEFFDNKGRIEYSPRLIKEIFENQ